MPIKLVPEEYIYSSITTSLFIEFCISRRIWLFWVLYASRAWTDSSIKRICLLRDLISASDWLTVPDKSGWFSIDWVRLF